MSPNSSTGIGLQNSYIPIINRSKVIKFLVIVPVLSEKICVIYPKSSFNSTLFALGLKIKFGVISGGRLPSLSLIKVPIIWIQDNLIP